MSRDIWKQVAVIPTIHVSFFTFLFPNFCPMCTKNTGFQEEEAATLFINEKNNLEADI